MPSMRKPREYNTANQLVATRTYSSNSNSELQLVPLAYTYICYNSLGRRTLAVEDMNRNGQIDFEGVDRDVSNDTRYVALGGAWWRETRQWSIHDDDSAVACLVGVRRSRVTGLGANGLASESVSIDPRGNPRPPVGFI